MRRLVSPVLAAAAALAGCGDAGPPSTELFPLEPGRSWTYRQETALEDGTREVAPLVIRTLAPADLDGRRAFRRRSDDGVEYWLRRDGAGIYRVAMRHETQAEPVPDAGPRFVLKEPLAVGTEWQSATVPYLLKRVQGFPPELRHEGKPLPMRYAIEALDVSVEVPAGRFERCVTVKGAGSLKLYADAVAGWRDVAVTTREWYCPGAGLVKLQRDEPAGSPFLIGGSVVLLLESLQRP